MAENSIVSISHLNKWYGDFHVLRDINLDVAKGERIVATGEGNGPVNALDNALRLALERLYPELARLELADYKVRILEGSHGTGAVTRVLVESSDGDGTADDMWSTVGVDENIIAASWHALEEAVTYGLLRAGRQPS